MQTRVVLGVLVGIIVGAVAGASSVYAANRMSVVRVVEGTTSVVNDSGTAIGLDRYGKGDSNSYRVAGARWRDLRGDDGWHDGPRLDGSPTCLEPLTSGQAVRLGVMKAPPKGTAPGGEVVVWVECLP